MGNSQIGMMPGPQMGMPNPQMTNQMVMQNQPMINTMVSPGMGMASPPPVQMTVTTQQPMGYPGINPISPTVHRTVSVNHNGICVILSHLSSMQHSPHV